MRLAAWADCVNRVSSRMLRQHNPPTEFPPGIQDWSLLATNSSASNGMTLTFLTSRRVIPEPVFTDATLISPSHPGKTSTILPSGHCIGFELSSTRRTTSPTDTFRDDRCHFVICCRELTYSLCHLLRNSCDRRWMNCQRDIDEICLSNRLISGTVVSALPISKWAGVKGWASIGLSERGVMGLEFMVAATWAISVDNSSNVNI